MLGSPHIRCRRDRVAAVEPRFMMRGRSQPSSRGFTARVTYIRPLTLVSTIASQASRSAFWAGSRSVARPALLTSRSSSAKSGGKPPIAARPRFDPGRQERRDVCEPIRTLRKGLEPVVPASHRDNPVAVGGEASYDRRAEAGGCSCDEDLQFNLLTRGFDVCCDFDLRKAALRCLHKRLATKRASSSEADVVGGLAVQ